MGFVREMIAGCMDIWEGYLEHPFIREMADGSLPEDKMKQYIIEDSLYLREYAKIFALGIQKASSMEEMLHFHRMIGGIVDGEWVTRDRYLEQHGIARDAWERCEQAPENRAYTDYMMQVSMDGSLPEIMAATLPCTISYCFIGRTLAGKNPDYRNSKYGELIHDYACDAYYEAAGRDEAFADTLCEGLPLERKDRLKEIFRQSSLHEMKFWDMAYQGRNK